MAPWHALRPAAALLLPRLSLSLFTPSSAPYSTLQATATRWVIREAHPSAPRESPTPLILLRTPGIAYPSPYASPTSPSSTATSAAEAEDTWRLWADMFSKRGWTTVEVDVSVSVPLSTSSPDSLSSPAQTQAQDTAQEEKEGGISAPIKAASDALSAQLRLLAIPFAPVIIASGPACLVAQAYVSDHPASGMVLIEPPPDQDPREAGGAGVGGSVQFQGAKAAGGGAKPFAWPTFRYEPRFPILLVAPQGAEDAVRATRVGGVAGQRPGGRGVSVMIEKDGARGDGTRMVSEVEEGADGRKWSAGSIWLGTRGLEADDSKQMRWTQCLFAHGCSSMAVCS